jgi:hypothetical protein
LRCIKVVRWVVIGDPVYRGIQAMFHDISGLPFPGYPSVLQAFLAATARCRSPRDKIDYAVSLVAFGKLHTFVFAFALGRFSLQIIL